MDKYENHYEEETKQRPSRRCHMKGCPLIGSMSDSIKGGGPWWCSYHFSNRVQINFTPEEQNDLQKISMDYNLGKRDYGAGYPETNVEASARKLSSRTKKNRRVVSDNESMEFQNTHRG